MLNIPHILWSSAFVLNSNPTYLKPHLCFPHTAASACLDSIHYWQKAVPTARGGWGHSPASPCTLPLQLLGRAQGATGAGKSHSPPSTPWCGWTDTTPENPALPVSLVEAAHLPPHFLRLQQSRGCLFHSRRTKCATVITARTS